MVASGGAIKLDSGTNEFSIKGGASGALTITGSELKLDGSPYKITPTSGGLTLNGGLSVLDVITLKTTIINGNTTVSGNIKMSNGVIISPNTVSPKNNNFNFLSSATSINYSMTSGTSYKHSNESGYYTMVIEVSGDFTSYSDSASLQSIYLTIR